MSNMAQEKNFYEKSYQKFTPDWLANDNEVSEYLAINSETLINYYEDYADQFNFPHKDFRDLKVLDLGCGLGGLSIYFAQKGAAVTGVDISSLAISSAQTIAANKGLEIQYLNMDVCEFHESIDQFDLIIDSHLLHCITENDRRNGYWSFVNRHLTKNGIILLETMCYQDQLEIPVGYSFDENYTLWQDLKITNSDYENVEYAEHELPIRKLLPSIEIEKEIKSNHFNIHYLYYHAELSFDVFSEYKNYPHKHLPKTLRIAATKNTLS